MKINVIGILIGLYLLVAALALVGVMVWAVANFPICGVGDNSGNNSRHICGGTDGEEETNGNRERRRTR